MFFVYSKKICYMVELINFIKTFFNFLQSKFSLICTIFKIRLHANWLFNFFSLKNSSHLGPWHGGAPNYHSYTQFYIQSCFCNFPTIQTIKVHTLFFFFGLPLSSIDNQKVNNCWQAAFTLFFLFFTNAFHISILIVLKPFLSYLVLCDWVYWGLR